MPILTGQLDLVLKPIEGKPISDQIYLVFRDAILSNKIRNGERLVESEIAHFMGTSQTPVREALQRLQNDGLVAKQQRSSAIVVETALDDYHELFQVRALIERLAIRRIAKTISPVQCRELEGLIGLMRQAAGRRDLLSLSLSDMEFHRRPCEWSGNTGLLRAWLPLSVQVLRFLTQYEIQDYETPNQIAEEHEGLLVDLCSHDVERAETAWSAHVLGSFRQLEDVQARQKPRASVLADVQV